MTTLTKWNEGEVHSSDGYFVRISLHRVSYVEGKRAASLDVERLAIHPYTLVVYQGTLVGWHPPFERDPMSPEEKAEVLRRISDGLEFLGVPFRLE